MVNVDKFINITTINYDTKMQKGERMYHNVKNRNWYIHIVALLVFTGTQMVHASEKNQARSPGEEQMLDQWPYLYYESQKATQTPSEKDEALTRALDFSDALKGAAWKLEKKKQLGRSASSNKLLEGFQNNDGDRIYCILGLDNLYQRNQSNGIVKPLTLEELINLRTRIRNVHCNKGGHGEQLKARYLLDIQDTIHKLEARK